ncbi:unnamed protein product [Heligmosomoides polygyrus]|uniref:Integrase catalytic domain-containing protein n=1 Tax=Heligmosomoides polygyrus TaxID=6339 RepID=A0A183GIV9_HELPZ|nr:unnamed protein product [Heligmosomoides polygyrus]
MVKSKLPSIKDNPTIPKLEMNALTMAARLSNTIFSALRNRVLIKEITIYSDSEIALGWIKNPKLDAKVGVLVRNRSKEVRKIVASLQQDGITVKFGYVDTTINPADAATRILSKQEFNDHSLWWNGQLISAYPNKTGLLKKSSVYRKRRSRWAKPFHLRQPPRLSTARWLERITKRTNPDLRDKLLSRIPELRFHYEDDFITVPEAERTSKLLLRNHQQVHVEEKINPQKDRLIPSKDPEGIIRCRGRLQQSHLPDESKFPILVGAQSALASLIIKDAHASFHLGTAHTMTRVREKFWIPQLRRQVQKILRRCVPCQRMNNRPYRYPEMSDLPARRVTPSRPFLHVGIDYFGPITVRSPTEETSKAYGIILTCTVTPLLHLECVPDMSTEQLLNALRCSFARRGVPKTITSDNAPCFLLADQILNDAVSQVANDTTVAKVMVTKGILWKTITPYAPWQGSFYERLIKSVKHSMYKTLGRAEDSRGFLTTDQRTSKATIASRDNVIGIGLPETPSHHDTETAYSSALITVVRSHLSRIFGHCFTEAATSNTTLSPCRKRKAERKP